MAKVIEATYEETETRNRNQPYRIFTPLRSRKYTERLPKKTSEKTTKKRRLKMNNFFLDNKVREGTIYSFNGKSGDGLAQLNVGGLHIPCENDPARMQLLCALT